MTFGFDICEEARPAPDGFLAVVTAWVPTRDECDRKAAGSYAQCLTGPARDRAEADLVLATLGQLLRERLLAKVGPPARRVDPRPPGGTP